MKPIYSFLTQLMIAILGALVLAWLAPDTRMLLPYLLMLLGFGISYVAVAAFISKLIEKSGDSFYLVYLGISGMRFLFFLMIVTLLLVFRPDLKSTPLALALTLWFLSALSIEVLIFLTNLRPNSKKQL